MLYGDYTERDLICFLQSSTPTNALVLANKLFPQIDGIIIVIWDFAGLDIYLWGDDKDFWGATSLNNMPKGNGEKYPAYSIFERNELMRKFYRLKLEEGESIKGHISTTKELLGDISSVGPEVEEHEKVRGLLNSLPDSWNDFVATLFAIKNTVGLTFDSLCRALEQEELRRNSKRMRQLDIESSQVL